MNKPKEHRGGVIAPADIPLIKEALSFYLKNLETNDVNTLAKISALYHRLGRIE